MKRFTPLLFFVLFSVNPFTAIADNQEVWQQAQRSDGGVTYQKPNGDTVTYSVGGRAVTREEYVAEGDRLTAQYINNIQQPVLGLSETEGYPHATAEENKLVVKAIKDTKELIVKDAAEALADQAKRKAEIMAVKIEPPKALVSYERSGDGK